MMACINQSQSQFRNKYLIQIIYFFNQGDAHSRNHLMSQIRQKTNSRNFSFIVYVCLLQENKITENNEKIIEQGYYCLI